MQWVYSFNHIRNTTGSWKVVSETHKLSPTRFLCILTSQTLSIKVLVHSHFTNSLQQDSCAFISQALSNKNLVHFHLTTFSPRSFLCIHISQALSNKILVHSHFTNCLQQDSCASTFHKLSPTRFLCILLSRAQSNKTRTLLAQQSMTVLVSEQSPRKQECNSCT